MSKNRTSPDYSPDEQTNNEDSDRLESPSCMALLLHSMLSCLHSVFFRLRSMSSYSTRIHRVGVCTAACQQHHDTKRARLNSSSDRTLEDLPVEMLGSILIRAVAMEVMEMNLAKDVWREKADLVIGRLGTVCKQWSNILTTDFFRNEIYRTLDGTRYFLKCIKSLCFGEKTLRVEILHQFVLQRYPISVLSLKDNVYVHVCRRPYINGPAHVIDVYDRNNLAEVKDVIEPPEINLCGMAGCSVSNCLYILNAKKGFQPRVLRITKEAEHEFMISPFIHRKWRPKGLAVAANGNLILYTSERVVVYDVNGTLQHEFKFAQDLCSVHNVIPKSNGNLVVESTKNESDPRIKLTEVDMNGTVLRQYQSWFNSSNYMSHSDNLGQTALYDGDLRRIHLLDAEFNLLSASIIRLDTRGIITWHKSHYNRERDEVLTYLLDYDVIGVIFRLTVE